MLKGPASFEQIEEIKKVHKKQFYHSQFEFLNETKGIRPNMLIGLIGTTGSGKSTLLKAIISSVAEQAKTLVWLTEETVTEYQAAMMSVSKNKTVYKNLSFLEEKELAEFYTENHVRFFELFKDMIVESEAEVVFIDNVSSSYFYSDDIGPRLQSKAAIYLSKICKELGVTIFYIAHTQKNIMDNAAQLITKEDIRGSQKLPIVSEYFYIIQKFTVNGNIYAILNIDKNRHHEIKNKFFLLIYKDGYKCDKKIDFETVGKIFNSRDSLGKTRRGK